MLASVACLWILALYVCPFVRGPIDLRRARGVSEGVCAGLTDIDDGVTVCAGLGCRVEAPSGGASHPRVDRGLRPSVLPSLSLMVPMLAFMVSFMATLTHAQHVCIHSVI
eukprot:849442-Rhodomonas_salina.2